MLLFVLYLKDRTSTMRASQSCWSSVFLQLPTVKQLPLAIVQKKLKVVKEKEEEGDSLQNVD